MESAVTTHMNGNELEQTISFETDPSNSSFTTEVADWLWTPITWSWFVSFQLVFALLGIGGNALVLIVIYYRRSSKNPTDILIGGLSAADFLSSIFMIPQPTLSRIPDNSMGQLACQFIHSSVFLWISIDASVFTLTAIAIERYIAVNHPIKFKTWLAPKHLVWWFILIWLLSIAINSRTFVTTCVDSTTNECLVEYQSSDVQKFVGVLVFLINFIIPILIMLVSYALIIRYLYQRSERFRQSLRLGKRNRSHDKSGPSQKFVSAREKVIKLMFIIIITFILCWLPDQCGLLAYNMQWVGKAYLDSPIYRVFVLVAFFNSCANPFIYAIQYPDFRDAVARVLSCSKTNSGTLFG